MLNIHTSSGQGDLQSQASGDRIGDPFKALVIETALLPVITDETRAKYLNQFVAFSLTSQLPEWSDQGASTSRTELSKQMLPLVCGKDYFVHPIE